MRKTTKDERVVFYYNGHGVPRPTPSGEIWVFNKSRWNPTARYFHERAHYGSDYTQYIPVSLYDLQEWLGS